MEVINDPFSYSIQNSQGKAPPDCQDFVILITPMDVDSIDCKIN